MLPPLAIRTVRNRPAHGYTSWNNVAMDRLVVAHTQARLEHLLWSSIWVSACFREIQARVALRRGRPRRFGEVCGGLCHGNPDIATGGAQGGSMKPISYARHRFPPEVILHAIWLYLRFTLSYRDVEELLVERGFCQGLRRVCHVRQVKPVLAFGTGPRERAKSLKVRDPPWAGSAPLTSKNTQRDKALWSAGA
jgi:hypothetical protein